MNEYKYEVPQEAKEWRTKTYTPQSVRWIVQKSMIEQNINSKKLPEVIKGLGYDVLLLEEPLYPDTDQLEDMPFFDEGSGPFVSYGSIQFIQRARKYPIYPGAYPNEDFAKLNTNQWMVKYPSGDLLNYGVYLPIQELINEPWKPFALFDSDGVFVKENLGFKRFAAKKVDMPKQLSEHLELYKDTQHINDYELVFVAPLRKDIISEHRFFIVNGEVVAGSTYRYDGVLDVRSDYPERAKEFANRMAKIYSPLNVFTLDVAMTGDLKALDNINDALPKLIEVNGFSSAGLYACNLETIVKSVSDQAFKDYVDLTPYYYYGSMYLT